MSRAIRKRGMAGAAVLAAAMLSAATPPPAAPPVIEAKSLSFEPAGTPGSVNAPLVPGARATAMEMLRRVFPDLDLEGKYRTIRPVRPVADAVTPEMGAGYAQAEGEPSLSMGAVTSALVRQGRHAIGFVLGGGVLVADWLQPAPAVGGALYVQIDPGGQPVIEKAFAIAQGKAAVLVSNSHFNAGEGFEAYRLYAQGFSGLAEVYDGPSLYSFQLADEACGSKDTRQVLSQVRPLASRHGGHADIAMTVTETTNCSNDEDAPVKLRRFPFTLVWDAKARRYRGGSPALDRINKRRWD